MPHAVHDEFVAAPLAPLLARDSSDHVDALVMRGVADREGGAGTGARAPRRDATKGVVELTPDHDALAREFRRVRNALDRAHEENVTLRECLRYAEDLIHELRVTPRAAETKVGQVAEVPAWRTAMLFPSLSRSR